MQKIGDYLKTETEKNVFDRHKYVTKEFQDYGYRLALKLDDPKRISMYIRLAKVEKRAFLEQALSFAVDYPKAKNKARIFMWKLKKLKEGETVTVAKSESSKVSD